MPEIYLQFDFAPESNHGSNDGILDLPVMQIHADFVAYLELAILFLRWHAKECTSNHSGQAIRPGPAKVAAVSNAISEAWSPPLAGSAS